MKWSLCLPQKLAICRNASADYALSARCRGLGRAGKTCVASPKGIVRAEATGESGFLCSGWVHGNGSLAQQNSPDLDPFLLGSLERRLQRLDVHRGVKNVIKPFVVLQCLEVCVDDDSSGPCWDIYGKAQVERMRDDDTLAFVAESPGKAVDDGRHAALDEDVLVADRLVGMEVRVEKRRERFSEPARPLGARPVCQMVDWVDGKLARRSDQPPLSSSIGHGSHSSW